jgi:hypothetical protein
LEELIIHGQLHLLKWLIEKDHPNIMSPANKDDLEALFSTRAMSEDAVVGIVGTKLFRQSSDGSQGGLSEDCLLYLTVGQVLCALAARYGQISVAGRDCGDFGE